MPEQNKPFVVTDRRKFTMEGELRPDADPSPEREERESAPAAVAETPQPAANTPEKTGRAENPPCPQRGKKRSGSPPLQKARSPPRPRHSLRQPGHGSSACDELRAARATHLHDRHDAAGSCNPRRSAAS